jgi:hypothetical protein
MDRLYQLALLLTGDVQNAEQLFVSAFDHCLSGNPVFRPWVQTWAKRAIIIKAIESCKGSFVAVEAFAISRARNTLRIQNGNLLKVAALKPLNRFVFVMSVLEAVSDAETAVLLGVTQQNVKDARRRAMWQISGVDWPGGNFDERANAASDLISNRGTPSDHLFALDIDSTNQTSVR